MRAYDMNVETEAELSAVNDILQAIGEAPVSTLEGDSNSDVANARRVLDKINRMIQSRGWTFNIEEDVVLMPDAFSNLIPFSDDYLSVLQAGSATPYVNRGGYLYDRTAKSDRFTGNITVTMIKLREFDEMPECFRTYIVAKAARKFNSSFFGASEVEATLADEELEARQMCMEYEMDYGVYNMLDGDNFVAGQLAR